MRLRSSRTPNQRIPVCILDSECARRCVRGHVIALWTSSRSRTTSASGCCSCGTRKSPGSTGYPRRDEDRAGRELHRKTRSSPAARPASSSGCPSSCPSARSSASSRKQGAQCRTPPTESGDPQSPRARLRASRGRDALCADLVHVEVRLRPVSPREAPGASQAARSRCAARSDEMSAARAKGVSTLVACRRLRRREGRRSEKIAVPVENPHCIEWAGFGGVIVLRRNVDTVLMLPRPRTTTTGCVLNPPVGVKVELVAQAAGVSRRVLAARTALASSLTPARMADSDICA